MKFTEKGLKKNLKMIYCLIEKRRNVSCNKKRDQVKSYRGKEGEDTMEKITEIAKFFLKKEQMTHKKLQKLCYFAQAWHLANYDAPLVPDDFEAWVHGPVSPKLYLERMTATFS